MGPSQGLTRHDYIPAEVQFNPVALQSRELQVLSAFLGMHPRLKITLSFGGQSVVMRVIRLSNQVLRGVDTEG